MTSAADAPPANLIAFLRARLDEDDATARAAILRQFGQTGEWVIYDDKDHLSPGIVFARNGADALGQACDTEASWIGRPARNHIARHDPARVLRDVQAKRRIVDLHDAATRETPPPDPYQEGTVNGWREVSTDAVKLLAAVYADHDQYREEWRV